MRSYRFDPQSLSAQMILSFIALVLLTAVAAGVPAVGLIRGQLEHQAWAQVEQGSRATLALYEARQSELEGLATLMAERPTLSQLVTDGQQEALPVYLSTLQEGSGLDLVLICDPSPRTVAQAGEALPEDLCAKGHHSGSHLISVGPDPQVWLLAFQQLDNASVGQASIVVVGLALDDEFASQMCAQTGLEHTIVVNGQVAATSLSSQTLTSCRDVSSLQQSAFELEGHPFYATCLTLAEPGLQVQVALDVAGIVSTQRGLIWTLVVSILAVAIVASILGTYLAQRIGKPLVLLSEAAAGMSTGGLDSPLKVQARVREVALVAKALEGARADLRRTLAELRQEKAWSEHLLEAIVEGIVTLDRKGHIAFFSKGAERITGWRRDDVMGRTCDQVFRPLETDESFSQLIPPPGRRRKIHVELRDGREATLAVTGARLLPTNRVDAQVALVFRDISEEEAVHRLLGHFLANVAHEFKTPLSATAASVELLLDQAPDLSPAELEELLASLHLGVLGLQTLIDNLLEGASIEAGQFRVHMRPAHLDEIIADALQTIQPLLDKHGQRLVVELPAAIPVVHADPRRTVQVLVNLLSNASRYGPDDAEIEVSAALSGEWVRVTVADSGPGIPPEYRPSLFRRFVYPGLENHRAQVGAGLGLSIVKAVIEAHGGKVGVDDHEGGGAVFWFTLPIASQE
jgi:PAS domain S-box-containing protein